MLRDTTPREELQDLRVALGERRAELEALERKIDACGEQEIPAALIDATARCRSAVFELDKRRYALQLAVDRGDL